MKKNKAFKYRIYPTQKQIEYIEGAFRAARFIFNISFDREQKNYKSGVKSNLSTFGLNYHIKQHRKEFTFLKEYDSNIYNYEMENLSNAYSKFFKKQGGFPKFKSPKDQSQSFRTRNTGPEGTKCYINENGYLKIPKLKEPIEMVYHRPIVGKLKTVTISRKNGKYYASVMVEYHTDIKPVDVKKTIGIDLGIKSLIVTSDNEVIENPKFLKEHQEHLKVLQRNLARAKKGSNNRKKIAKSIANVYEKISNSRENFLHNVSKNLVDNNDLICIEDLNVKGMTKSNKGTVENPGKKVKQKSGLNRNILDAGFGIIKEMITYKADVSGKHIVKVGRFEPTSKKCYTCGDINTELTLKDRVWECKCCGSKNDRDHNAALNIREAGVKKFFDNVK